MDAALDDVRWLVSDSATAILAEVASELEGRPALPAQIRSLRNLVGAQRATLVLEQTELRRKGREKFPLADRLFFTRRGLEQATDAALATYKAQRFDTDGTIADLCCGIGGDAMGLAQVGSVRLIDRDPASLLFAQANVERSGGSCAGTVCDSVSPIHLQGIAGWHIDPDRRAHTKRSTRVELGEPGLETLAALLQACPHAAVKLAPAAQLPESWIGRCHSEWIETRGECRQLVAWFGRLAEGEGSSSATLINSHGEACCYTGDVEEQLLDAAGVGAYLFDPSPSLVASHLVAALANALDLQRVSSHSLYLTGDESVQHPHLQCFQVIDDLPLDVRQLRTYFRSHNIGRLEIKKRGVDLTPEALRPQLDLRGDDSAVLLLMRLPTGTRAIVAQRTA